MNERAIIPVTRTPRSGGTDLFTRLRDQVDSLFDDFGALPSWRHLGESTPAPRFSAFRAAVDISETNEEFELTLDAPGFKKDMITVSIEDGLLTISGTTKEVHEEKGKTWRLAERSQGSFTRTFQLPASVDSDKVTAQMGDGVLHVHMPKSAEARKKAKVIDVKAA